MNTHRKVYVERLGRLEETSITFRDESQLRLIIDRIISRVGRRIDESVPLVDARLPDGSRVNAIIPPAALDGPMLSIRRFRRQALSIDDLLALGTLTPDIAEFLTGAVRARLNIMITGGTGSGKTTLLNILSRYISNHERIVTIEDSAELMLQQPHVVRLETRPPNIEGTGEITQRDLLRNTLRMRPDRILVGEVRGDEVLDMLQAMNTGHDGSLTTLHANGPRDALHRLENLVLMAGHNLPDRAIREQVANALNLVVHVARLSDGSRRVLSVQEILGMEGPGGHDAGDLPLRLPGRRLRGQRHRASSSRPASSRAPRSGSGWRASRCRGTCSRRGSRRRWGDDPVRLDPVLRRGDPARGGPGSIARRGARRRHHPAAERNRHRGTRGSYRGGPGPSPERDPLARRPPALAPPGRAREPAALPGQPEREAGRPRARLGHIGGGGRRSAGLLFLHRPLVAAPVLRPLRRAALAARADARRREAQRVPARVPRRA